MHQTLIPPLNTNPTLHNNDHIPGQVDLLEAEDCSSCQELGNDILDLDNHHIITLDTTTCLESKMDSLKNHNETYQQPLMPLLRP
jgi:hypothetical protein